MFFGSLLKFQTRDFYYSSSNFERTSFWPIPMCWIEAIARTKAHVHSQDSQDTENAPNRPLQSDSTIFMWLCSSWRLRCPKNPPKCPKEVIFGEGAAWWGSLKRFSTTFSHAWAWSWWLSGQDWRGSWRSANPWRGVGRSTYGFLWKKVGCGTSTEHLLLEENLVLLTRPKPISIR